MRRSALLVVLAAVCVTALGAATRASRDDGDGAARLELAPGFETDVVASGLTAPTAFAFLPDGRILVAEQAGVVRLVEDGEVAARPFLDISDHVNSHYERGLLGLAVDPDYAANGLVYLLYTYENDADRPRLTKTARLTSVRARGDFASHETETVLLGRRVGSTCRPFPRGSDCIPNEWIGHSVGDLAFADDGTLFVSIGDASSWDAATPDALRAQDLDSLAGKLLHVTREGKGVPTNPFWNGDPDAARSKVWAYGLRNPFRFGLSPADGTPYVGDVGWETFEEIDVAAAGANLGWPCYEGNARQPKYARMAACRSLYARGGSATTRPLVAWSRGTLRASAIGGSFNTGPAFPPVFDGAYFYGDFVRGVIQYVHVDHRDRLVSGPWRFATGTRTPVDIQFGPNGALYHLSVMDGELRRIRFTGGETSARPGPRLVGQPAVFPAGRNPHSVTAVDIDRDGVLDLVAANAGGDDVAVLLGLTDGGFAPAEHYATGRRPKVAIVVDVDGDGSQDLVSANQDGSSVSVLVGRGDATFGRAADYPVCSRAHDVAAGDLDGDGDPDLAVACFDGSVVSVLLGNGDGSFRQAVDHDSGDGPHSVVMRDLDGDGRLDLAVANHGSDDVAVLLGKGDATFEQAVLYDVGSRPHAIEAADLDGDGHLDLVTANDGSDDVSVLRGEGDGTFADAVAYAAGSVPKGLAVADVNGDGREDVVTANTGGNYDGDTRSPLGDTVSVLLGTGDGRIGVPVTYVAGRTPFSVTVADLDRDGVEDLATANWHGGTVSVIPGRRRG
jgi:glucose/arabinose dehydrogenase